jgi:hypothetical protein
MDAPVCTLPLTGIEPNCLAPIDDQPATDAPSTSPNATPSNLAATGLNIELSYLLVVLLLAFVIPVRNVIPMKMGI